MTDPVDIAIVTQTTGHAAINTTANVVRGFGHTVDVFQEGAVTDSNLSDYGLILAVRCSSATPQTVLAGYLREYISAGIPVLFGLPQNYAGSNYITTLQTLVGLASHVDIVSSSATTYLIRDHPVFEWFNAHTSISAGGGSWASYVNLNNLYSGTVYATRSSSNVTSGSVVLAEPGDLDIYGTPWGARVGHIAFLFGASSYSANGLAILERLIDWATELEQREISGTIHRENVPWPAATLRLYSRETGVLVQETTSDENGEFHFPAIFYPGDFDVLAIGPEEYRPLVHGPVTPEPIK